MVAFLLPFFLLTLQVDRPGNEGDSPPPVLIPSPLEMIARDSALGSAETEVIRLYRHLRPALVRVDYQLGSKGDASAEGGKKEYFVSGVVVQETAAGCLVVAPGFHGELQATIQITDFQGDHFSAKQLATETVYGLSLLEVSGLHLEPPPFGFCQTLPVGSFTLVIGNGFGLNGSFSLGFLSGKGRRLGGAPELLQLTNSLNLGDGGGLVSDRRGFLIGIAMTSLREAAQLAPTNAVPQGRAHEMSRAEGVGFAVPVHEMLATFSEFLRPALPNSRPLLGVSVQVTAIEPQLRRRLGLPSQALVQVLQVSDEMPAAQAGVQVGDYILGFGGFPVESLECLQTAMDLVPRQGVMVLLREGKVVESTIVWRTGPNEKGAAGGRIPEVLAVPAIKDQDKDGG